MSAGVVSGFSLRDAAVAEHTRFGNSFTKIQAEELARHPVLASDDAMAEAVRLCKPYRKRLGLHGTRLSRESADEGKS